MGDLNFGPVTGKIGGNVNQAEEIHFGDDVSGTKIVASDNATIIISETIATVDAAEAPDHVGPIFVSHAHADRETVRGLLEVMSSGLQLHDNDILATSLVGKEIPVGVNWADYLKARLTDTRLVIMVLTPKFFESEFCLIELGAMWVMDKKVVPIVIPPLEQSDLGHILRSMQCLDATKDSDLARARAEMAKALDQTAPDIDLTEPAAQFKAALNLPEVTER